MFPGAASDARLEAKSTTVVERLLSISGEDRLTIDRKYRDPWTGRLGVRFLILTNELPRFTDASGALASRFIILTLRENFFGREDKQLTQKLLPELPGILNWALLGRRQLRKDGRFIMPRSSQEEIAHLQDLASPVTAFVRECCEVGPGKEVNVKQMFSAWTHWSEIEGHRPGSHAVFGRNLRSAFPRLRTKGRGIDRTYVGIDLNEVGEEQYLEAQRRRDHLR